MIELFFWILVFLLFHSYVLFPEVINILGRKKHANSIIYTPNDDLPFVSIIISAYNEEKVIERRITHIFNTTYPLQKIEVLVGSDGSNDKTNYILESLADSYPGVRLFLFDQRRGKGNVLNRLVREAKGDILLLTDAKVEFSDRTVFELIKNFKNPGIGIVGGNLINKKISQDGISIQEDQFMSREIQIKYNEGVLWGTTMGVYGACYAVRKELFPVIPESFAVEDFYITLCVLEKKYKSIIEIEAECYEDVPNFLPEEFRRKVRISSGNFQNLRAFSHLILKLNSLSFTFVSHKVIRWLGPFIITGAIIFNLFLLSNCPFYLVIFAIQLLLLIIPIIDFFLHKIHLHIIPLRFVTHFYTMNLALLIGFVKYLKGVKTNVWEPTKR
jgi:cellulose synthase/poly-beta-1,6-N-acetylglucosamine synthase-like glycosyltransferase